MSALAASIFGLFVANMTNVSVPLTSIQYSINVKSFASHITIHQTYENKESIDLECVYGFPISDQAAVVALTITIGERTLKSQFKPKDEAFNEYTSALARGDGAYLLDQSDRSDDTFVMSVGRLPAGKKCTVSISYVNNLESVTETKLRLTIPTSLYPRYNPSFDAPKGVLPPENYQADVPYKAKISGWIEMFDVIRNISSPTHVVSVKSVGGKTTEFECSGDTALDRDFLLEVDVETAPEHYVEVERLADGKLAAMYAFVPNFRQPDSDVVKTELIFVVDCSGSMDEEGKIDYAKRAMQIFLRSVPQGCYFNFYRFGSRFEKLFNESELYASETFEKARVYATETSANLGGTEILEPLQQIFSTPLRSGFARQVFLLTDGDVTNTEQVISLVQANSFHTRLFTFGLGNSPSRSLINGVAAAGNGKAEFIKKGLELGKIVARQLTRALRPGVTDAVISWKGVKNLQHVPNILPPVFKGDRQLNYAIFDVDNTPNSDPHIEWRRGASRLQIPLEIPSAEEKSIIPPFLHHLAARALIKQLEIDHNTPRQSGHHGSLQSRTPVLTNDQLKEKITGLSINYGVLSKFVSLIAVEHRNGTVPENGTLPHMSLREIPIQTSRFEWNDNEDYSSLVGLSNAMPVYHDADDMEIHDIDLPDRTTSATPVVVDSLSQLLSLQQWNGAWTFSPEIEYLTNWTDAGLKANLLKLEAAGLSDEAASTVFVMTYIKRKYPEQADVWSAILGKGADFLETQLTEHQSTISKLRDHFSANI